MTDFTSRYKALNTAQRQAVDTIEGPVMVVAGPGTGKTELLGMRVANILQKTDTLPQNILCLTYTESGAYAMRERLAGLIGADAHKVAVHTFHSFGSEIINRYGEYFYNGAHFHPADELSSHEVLKTIFEKLPHSERLASKMNDDFTYLRDTQAAISDIKKSGLTSDELLMVLDRNDRFTTWLQPRLASTFADRVSKKIFDGIDALVGDIAMFEDDALDLVTYEPLSALVGGTLEFALDQAREESSTKPITAWKREWCEKRDDGSLTLKDEKRSARLRTVAKIYYEYLIAMQERALFDFDDMILRSVHALEVYDDLRYNLQEQFQYILVDEFQDTNDAQMRMLWNLTNNPVAEGRPNVMVVGDDDQAIYRFQGAKLSNILDFRDRYRDVAVVSLTDNYRSAGAILETARRTILQAEERLERSLPNLDKTLTPHYKPEHPHVSFAAYEDELSEYAALAEKISLEQKNAPDRTIAIIARHHRQLQEMLPYLQHANIPLSYDRRDNVLETAPVKFLELLARVVTYIGSQHLEEANALLPELLSHKAWGLSRHTLWKLSIDSHTSRQLWLETMLSNEGELADLAEWLIYSAHLALHEPLEYMIDHLTGTVEEQASHDGSDESPGNDESSEREGFKSPLRDYFFSHDMLTRDPSTYIGYLDALSAIRRKVRDYHSSDTQLYLRDFIYCLDQYIALGIGIQGSGHVMSDGNTVELLSAHRSKGLEFDSVYIVGLSETIWGNGGGKRAKLIGYPHNLPIGIGGDSNDEHIRLLFVALTRAKTSLYLSTHHASQSGKQALPVGFLSHLEPTTEHVTLPKRKLLEYAWHAELTSSIDHSMEELLRDRLKHYKLSATHLCNFLDVSRGGPELFLLQNLLRFPQAMSPSAAFGSAVHATLQRAHAHYSATGKKRPVEDLLGDFEALLGNAQLSSDQHDYFAKKGTDVLSYFLAKRYDSFSETQRLELSFATENVIVGGARLTGAIDLMDIDYEAKTIYVTDYKTGKPTDSWRGKTDYEKIKLHHYRQQLLFYKLLIENSRQFSGYTVTKGYIEYVEADTSGAIHRLELEYDDAELAEFSRLISGAWKRIQTLNFTTDQKHPETISGIESFEAEVAK